MRQKTRQREISEYIEQKQEIWRGLIIRNITNVGEQSVNAARASNGYKDQTGNLRSSTGYVVADDRQIVTESSFAQVKQGGKGSSEGRTFAQRLAHRARKGVALIVVAGMEYASYVASKRDVLDSAELLANRLLPQMLQQLRNI